MRLTDQDHSAIADHVVEKLRAQTVCPHGIDGDAARDILAVAKDWRSFEAGLKVWLGRLFVAGVVGGLVVVVLVLARWNWLAELVAR